MDQCKDSAHFEKERWKERGEEDESGDTVTGLIGASLEDLKDQAGDRSSWRKPMGSPRFNIDWMAHNQSSSRTSYIWLLRVDIGSMTPDQSMNQ